MPIQRVTHIGLCVSDLERSRHFYRDLLGFEEKTHFTVDGEPTATTMGLPELSLHCAFLERDGIRIELMSFPTPGTVGETALRPTNHVGFTHFGCRVQDIEEVERRLVSGGAQVLHDTRVENPDFESKLLWVTDPDGVRIELVEMPGDPAALLGEPV